MFQSVTAFGRMMIEQTKQHVEQHYTIANGYKHDAKVCERLQTRRQGMWTAINTTWRYVNGYKHDAKVCERL